MTVRQVWILVCWEHNNVDERIYLTYITPQSKEQNIRIYILHKEDEPYFRTTIIFKYYAIIFMTIKCIPIPHPQILITVMHPFYFWDFT